MSIVSLDELLADVRAADTNAGSHLHGQAHWKCVAYTGLQLINDVAGADGEIVFLFGLFHDSQRRDDGHDIDHGRRAAALVTRLHGKHFQLDDRRLALLVDACAEHVDTDRSDEPTIGLCWDSDRLNLWRVGIRPLPKYLSTAVARKPENIERFRDLGGAQLSWRELWESAIEHTHSH